MIPELFWVSVCLTTSVIPPDALNTTTVITSPVKVHAGVILIVVPTS